MIKQFKLTNGDDIIGDLEEVENFYVVKNPYKILQMVNSAGDLNICLTPWFLYNDIESPVFIIIQHIVAYTIPSSKIMSFYEKSLSADKEESIEMNRMFLGETIH